MRRKEEGRTNLTHPKPVVAAEDLDAEDVLVVVEKLQSLGAGGRREAGFHIDFSNAPDPEISAYHAPAYEGFVPLRLVESPHQRPHLLPQDINQGRRQ